MTGGTYLLPQNDVTISDTLKDSRNIQQEKTTTPLNFNPIAKISGGRMGLAIELDTSKIVGSLFSKNKEISNCGLFPISVACC